MTSLDHLALRDIGRHMAKTNGYKPEQGSDLYITHGESRDYLYGTYRIFAYTFEMSDRDYPKTPLIAPETGRNKEAVLWLAERAWCPLSVLGAVGPAGALRRLRRRLRGRPRLDRQPGRHRYRARVRPLRARQPVGHHEPGGTTLQPSSTRVGSGRVRDRAGGGLVGRRRTTSTG